MSRRRLAQAVREAAGLARNPLRAGRLVTAVASDGWRAAADRRHLYRYATTRVGTRDALGAVMGWLRRAQRADGGVAAFYGLNTGWAPSYPETTGYIIPTFHDHAALTASAETRRAAGRMTDWLLGLQLPGGAFPEAWGEPGSRPSVFNTGQILHGLVRSARETGDEAVLAAAARAGDWLVEAQHPDGRWEGPMTYLGRAHSYHTMVAWSLALLAEATDTARYRRAAVANLDWALGHRREDGWFGGIGLPGHPTFLHFVAYLIQGMAEAGLRADHERAVDAAREAAWRLLRAFELRKRLPGALAAGWRADGAYACLTGNAQMSCVWLRLYAHTGDLRFLNAALKMNELLKERIPRGGPAGVRGGVAGSAPIWGAYQPLRYINWGAKFAADAFIGELRAREALP